MNLSENIENCPTCELEENINYLRQTYFFSGIAVDALKVFSYLCQREKFGAGEYLFRQGEDDGQAYYLISGKAVLERTEQGQTRKVRDCKPDDFFGGLALLGKLPRLYSLKTEEETLCLVLSREKFIKVWAQFPEMSNKLLQAILNAVNTWEDRLLANCGLKEPECLQRLGISVL
jgi:CRP-like cAMP-binding protein